MGCSGFCPACCSNCTAASGQSVTQVVVSGSSPPAADADVSEPAFMPANALAPTRLLTSKPSTFMA